SPQKSTKTSKILFAASKFHKQNPPNKMKEKIMKCPRCGSILCTIEYDGVQIEVCPECKGEWLHAGELEKIVEHHDEVFTPEEIASLDAVNKEIFTAERDDHDELNCPH